MPVPMMIVIVPMTVTVAKQKRAHNVYDQTHYRNERSSSELNLRWLQKAHD